MTVTELIEILQAVPPHTEVMNAHNSSPVVNAQYVHTEKVLVSYVTGETKPTDRLWLL